MSSREKNERAKIRPDPKYSCALCPYSTNVFQRYTVHQIVHSRDRPFTCPELNCHYRAKSGQTLKSHVKNVHLLQSKPMSSRPFPCPHFGTGCNYAAKETSDLNRHLKIHCKEKTLFCSQADCNYSTNVQRNLVSHTRVHTGEKPFVCQFESCTFAAAHRNTLLLHTGTHTKERPYKCPEANCEYAAAQLAHLKNHQLTHSPKEGEQRPLFKCPLCEYSVNRKDSLSVHLKSHSVEKPFACSVESCDYRCNMKSSLFTHLKTHSEERQYKCELCPYRGKTRQAVSGHLKNVHSDPNVGPFKCTEPKCDHESKNKDALSRHILIHKGEKKYGCPFPDCDYRAARKSSLKKHENEIHSNDKKEKCGLCDFKCKKKSVLNTHFRTHTKEKPYICKEPDCEYEAKKLASLKQYQKKHHPQLFKQGK